MSSWVCFANFVTIKSRELNTIKFHKTECGVDFLLNVLSSDQVKEAYIDTDFYNTDYFEILFFKKAKGTLVLNQQRITVTDNSVVFISAFQKRQWKLNEEHLKFTTLVFQEDFLNEFFADKLFTYRLLYFYQFEYPLLMSVTLSEIMKCCGTLTEIKDELVETKPDSVHIIRSLLYYLLQTLNRQYANLNHLSLEKAENNYAYQLKKLMETHIREKQRVNDYAEMLGISRIFLNKLVKEQFNLTATDLIKQRLLIEIQNLLIHSNKTITEISFELGFSEPNHLMRFFKNQTNQTTSQFLSNYQKSFEKQ